MQNLLNKHYLFVLTIVSIVFAFFIHKHSFNFYFFQDDFYELVLSNASNLKEYINFFYFMENRSSYRPVGLQSYFFISQNIFGLNPMLFRLLTFTLLVSSFFLISKIIRQLINDNDAGKIAAILWVTSSVHFLSISWIAAAWLIIGTFFYLLTTLTFIKFIDGGKRLYYIICLLLFLMTLGSFEFFLSWPVVISAWLFLFRKFNHKKIAYILSPFVLIVLVYAYLRFTNASLPSIDEYKIELGLDTVKNIVWYFLWSFNIPEELKKQVINNLFILNPVFLNEFKSLVLISFISFTVMLFIVIAFPIIKRLNKKISKKIVYFAIIWFLTSLLPVVIFPNHTFVMYLALPSIGIYTLVGYMLSFQKARLLIVIFIFVWLFSSFTTINFYYKSYWVSDSQKFALYFSREIKSSFPTLPENAVVYFPNYDKRQQQAILNENAIKVIYDNENIRLFFDEVSLENYLKNNNISRDNVINFNPKGP